MCPESSVKVRYYSKSAQQKRCVLPRNIACECSCGWTQFHQSTATRAADFTSRQASRDKGTIRATNTMLLSVGLTQEHPIAALYSFEHKESASNKVNVISSSTKPFGLVVPSRLCLPCRLLLDCHTHSANAIPLHDRT